MADSPRDQASRNDWLRTVLLVTLPFGIVFSLTSPIFIGVMPFLFVLLVLLLPRRFPAKPPVRSRRDYVLAGVLIVCSLGMTTFLLSQIHSAADRAELTIEQARQQRELHRNPPPPLQAPEYTPSALPKLRFQEPIDG